MADFFSLLDQTGEECRIRLRLKVIPGAKYDKIDGIIDTPDGPALKVRITAIAEKNLANKSLVKFLAKQFGIPVRNCIFQSGEKSRLKSLILTGNHNLLMTRLEEFKASSAS